MRWFLFLMVLLSTLTHALASDYGREKRWADEVAPGVLDGDVLWLEQSSGHKYLALYLPAAASRGAVIVVHGMGVHPDWGINAALRSKLAEQGYSTLSIQMPVLAAEAKSSEYAVTFSEAGERIAKAAAWLQTKGYAKVAIVSHSLGGRMTRTYFLANASGPIQAWAALSIGYDDFQGINVPVLDVYADRDNDPVLNMVAARKASQKHRASAQHMLTGTNHFYVDKESEAVRLVREWLDKTL